MLDLLGQRRFAPLFLTQFLGAFNDNVFKNALVIFIAFRVAGEDARDASLLVVAAGGIFILPFMLFSPLAGDLADKYDKAWLIRRIKLAECCIMFAGGLAFIAGSLAGLLLVLFVMGLQSAAFGPLKYSILPQHLAQAELLGGNALVQTSTYLAILGGTVLGGLVVASGPRGPGLVAASTLLIAAAGWLASRWIPPAPAGMAALVPEWNPLRGVVRMLREAAREGPLWRVMLAISWFWFVGAASLSLVPGYTRVVLAGNEQVATLLLTAFSLGIGAGSMSCARLAGQRARLRLVAAGALAMAVFGVDLALVSPAPMLGGAARGPLEVLRDPGALRAVLDLFGLAMAGGFYIVPLYTLLQVLSPDSTRARMVAANNILNALFMVASALVTMGLLAAGLGIDSIFAVIGLACLPWAMLVWHRRHGGGDSP